MTQSSAGILLYRLRPGSVEVLLGHPGGPFFRNRDAGAWSLPKGLLEAGEPELDAARREFREETGMEAPAAVYLDLGEVTLQGGKRVRAWAVAGDCDPAVLRSNNFEIEWPPRSGRRRRFPEIDRFEFFDVVTAASKINPRQAPFLERLLVALGQASG